MPLVSVEEAARALGLGRSKTYELIAEGALETVHIGRAARVPVDAIATFVERLRGHRTEAGEAPPRRAPNSSAGRSSESEVTQDWYAQVGIYRAVPAEQTTTLST